MRIRVAWFGKLVQPLRRILHPSVREAHFRINLSSRYRPGLVPLRALLVGTCVIFAVGICWNVGQAIVAHQQSRAVQAERDHARQQDEQLLAEARAEGIDLSEAALQRLPFAVNLANELLEKRTFSWTKFLSGLEQAIPQRLALTSIRLDPGGSLVHLTGSAMSLEDVTAFTVGLQDHPRFKDPVLAQHRVGTNGLVEFDVTLRYRRDGV